jgi:hypothetical protein
MKRSFISCAQTDYNSLGDNIEIKLDERWRTSLVKMLEVF